MFEDEQGWGPCPKHLHYLTEFWWQPQEADACGLLVSLLQSRASSLTGACQNEELRPRYSRLSLGQHQARDQIRNWGSLDDIWINILRIGVKLLQLVQRKHKSTSSWFHGCVSPEAQEEIEENGTFPHFCPQWVSFDPEEAIRPLILLPA